MKASQPRRLLGVLVTFRRPEELKAMLHSVAAQDRELDSLVVVDNDPTPQNEEIVRRSDLTGRHVEYIRAAENLGPAGGIALGMNRLLEFAEDRDWIVLMDDDDPPFSTTVFRDLETFGESMLARDPQTAAVGMVGSRFDRVRGRLISMSRIANGLRTEAVPVDYIGGGRFPLYLVAAVRAVGSFSSKLFFAFDDFEYGLRLRTAGFSLYAHRSLWRKAREADGQIGLDVRPSLRLSDLSWRRYYEMRNVLHILGSSGRTGTAVRIFLIRGLGKPLANLLVNPRASMKLLRMNLRAGRDAWTGRMGRTLEPDAEPRR